jgi:NAD(P)-dependent dehydrogenase (short-subunit alcohol dehydrogenase family)
MKNSFEGTVALVTGGSSGIGKAIAKCFVDAGGRVAILSRNAEELEEATSEIDSEGKRVFAIVADVTDEKALRHGVAEIVERWGRLDVVVANAGTNGVWAPIDELTADEWRSTLDINLTGTFLTIKAAESELRKRGGSVIVMSSVNGTRMFSNGGASAYASSKAGQVALTKMLALELAKHKIRVNAICPGAIETPINDKTVMRDRHEAMERVHFPDGEIPLTDGEPGTPEQVGTVALFLASDAASHVTGSVIYVDGAQSLLQG